MHNINVHFSIEFIHPRKADELCANLDIPIHNDVSKKESDGIWRPPPRPPQLGRKEQTKIVLEASTEEELITR